MVEKIDIEYVVGDATAPRPNYSRINEPHSMVIVHCVNDIGQWGSGFVLAVSKLSKNPEWSYRKWHREGSWEGTPFELGQVQMVHITDFRFTDGTKKGSLWVCNLIGQHRNIQAGEKKPIRYDALRSGLAKVREFCLDKRASAHMPRIGADRARGDWSVIEKIIEDELCSHGVYVTVYDLSV